MSASIRIAALLLGVATLAILSPFWAPLVLAVWAADLAQPLLRKLQAALGGRKRAAGAITVLIVLIVMVPMGIGLAAVASSAVGLLRELQDFVARGGGLTKILGRPEYAGINSGAAVSFFRDHGAEVWGALTGIAQASVSILVGAFVFVAALYSFATSGREVYAWIVRNAPIDARAVHRFALAFRETGRGLLIGTGVTALAQGALASIVYASLGVQRPLTLGLLTGLCSFVPAVGTALVWVPVAAGLAIHGYPVRALILVGLGAGVIGTVDNLLRPMLTRYGRLRLPVVVTFLSMIGGLSLIGGWGLLLGPLVTRLAMEAFAIVRERRLWESAQHRSG